MPMSRRMWKRPVCPLLNPKPLPFLMRAKMDSVARMVQIVTL
jgi:hypothetical protein